MEVKKLFDLPEKILKQYSFKKDCFGSKENGTWITIDATTYYNYCHFVASGLIAKGINRNDKILTIVNNRTEWNYIDMGIMICGAIHVPVYPNISDSDYEYIIQHSDAKLIIVANEELFNKISNICKKIGKNIEIITVNKTNLTTSLIEIIDLGKKSFNKDVLEKIKNSISENDLATIIYTSGTTGNPKGVMLSHKNIVSNFIAVSDIPPYGPKARILSFLPLCHIYERMMNYMYQYNGYSIYYAENITTIAENIKEIKPHIITTVPRLLESIFDKIINKGHTLKGFKKKIFFWAVDLGLKYKYKNNSIVYNIKLAIARILVFNKWKKALGGNLDIIVSGGAALQPRLSSIFWAAGFRVLEGYGLTETSPVIAVSHFGKDGIAFGTVGPILKGVEVKISNENEILCKGPNVMLGYYKDPELTKQVIDQEGWFHTGDLGYITEKGQLKITGRKKEMFKTSAGKYIVPQIIENKFKESPFILHIMVIGDNRKFPAALIVPNFENLRAWCERKNIQYTDNATMINHPEIKKRFQKVVEKMNSHFGVSEQIVKYALVTDEWSVLSGELTPSLKLKRKFIEEKYKDIIETIYKN